jgi:hypothetical protein
MSNMIRKFKRNEAKAKYGTRDHNIITKMNKKKAAKKRIEEERKEKVIEDKNLGF